MTGQALVATGGPDRTYAGLAGSTDPDERQPVVTSATPKGADSRHSCDAEIRAIPDGWGTSGWRQEGEQWTCSCGKTYTHICDEAEGCFWSLNESREEAANAA